MPKVSVIIPIYNYIQFLPQAIESVLNQTFQDFEIILIDDGSTVDVKSVVNVYIEKYSDKIKYIHQRNQGVSTARNKGILEATGEYVSFLDQDDLYLPQKLEKICKYLDDHKDVALVYTDMQLINDKGENIKQWLSSKKYFGEGSIYKNLLNENFFIPTSVAIRKDVLKKLGGFDTNIVSADDLDLWLRIAKLYPIGLIKEPLVKWRIHGDNTSKNIPLMKNNVVKVYEKQLSEENDSEAKQIIKRKLGEEYFRLGNLDYKQGAVKKAREKLWKSLQFNLRGEVAAHYLFTFLPVGLVSRLLNLRSTVRKEKTREKVMDIWTNPKVGD